MQTLSLEVAASGPTFINIFGGPGCGKTTTAWKVAATLAELGYVVEVIPEFAKSLTWNKSFNVLGDQLFVFATQSHPLEMLRSSHLDFVIVDSPLPTSLAYMPAGFYPSFEPLVMEVFKSHKNVNYLLRRETNYVSVGRNETPDGAKLKDTRICDILHKHGVVYHVVGLSERDQIVLNALRERPPSVKVPELSTDISAPIREALGLSVKSRPKPQ